jgi:hypothetical protein
MQLIIAHKPHLHALSFLFPEIKQINVSEGNSPRRLAIQEINVLHRTNKYIRERERKTVSRYMTN